MSPPFGRRLVSFEARFLWRIPLLTDPNVQDGI